jgi:thiosulfate reductase cytochrome b subunit
MYLFTTIVVNFNTKIVGSGEFWDNFGPIINSRYRLRFHIDAISIQFQFYSKQYVNFQIGMIIA